VANEIEIRVTGRNDTAGMWAAINRGLAQAKAAAADASREVRALGQALGRLDGKRINILVASTATAEIRRIQEVLDRLDGKRLDVRVSTTGGAEIRRIAADLAALQDRRIRINIDTSAAGAVRGMTEQLHDLGDAALRAAMEIDWLNHAIGDLQDRRIRIVIDTSGLGGLGGGGGGAAAAGAGPYGAVLGAAVGAAMLPAIGAALAGTALAVTAATGIAAGIAGAARDTRVIAAAGDVKATLVGELTRIGTPFVGPVVDALSKIKTGVADLQLAALFEPLADVVAPVTDDLLEMAEQAMPGLREMFAESAPFIKEFAAELPALGRHIGEFASSMASAGPGATKFFTSLLRFVGVTVEGIGQVIEFLSKMYNAVSNAYNKAGGALESFSAHLTKVGAAVGKFRDWLDAAADGATGFAHGVLSVAKATTGVVEGVISWLGKAFDWVVKWADRIGIIDLGEAGEKLSGLTSSGAAGMDTLAESTASAADELQSLQQIMDALSGSAVSVMQAESDMQEAMAAASAAARENGATLDLATVAGRANWAALDGIRAATLARSQATFDDTAATQGSEMAARAAAQAFDAGRQAYINAAMAMGYTREQAQALADRMLAKPPDWNLKATFDGSAAIAAAAATANRIQEVMARANQYGTGGYAPSVTPNMTRAAGGPVSAGEMYLVGEHRAELFVPDKDGMIYPDVPRRGAGRPWSGDGGPSAATNIAYITVNAMDPRAAASAVGQALTEWVRTSGPIPSRMVAT